MSLTVTLIDEIEAEAEKRGQVIYNICQRNAGWAVQFSKEGAECGGENWREGLVIHAYYPSIGECLIAELTRLKGDDSQKLQAWNAGEARRVTP